MPSKAECGKEQTLSEGITSSLCGTASVHYRNCKVTYININQASDCFAQFLHATMFTWCLRPSAMQSPKSTASQQQAAPKQVSWSLQIDTFVLGSIQVQQKKSSCPTMAQRWRMWHELGVADHRFTGEGVICNEAAGQFSKALSATNPRLFLHICSIFGQGQGHLLLASAQTWLYMVPCNNYRVYGLWMVIVTRDSCAWVNIYIYIYIYIYYYMVYYLFMGVLWYITTIHHHSNH